LRYVTPKVDIP